jgi:hypothetical protein
VNASSANSPSADQGRRCSDSTATTPTASLVVGQRAGQHRADLAGNGRLAEFRPPAVVGEVFGADQFLDLEGLDAGTFLVLDLQVFQMREPVVGRRDAAQMLVGVDQHQACPVNIEHRVRGVHDLTDRVFHPHLPKAELAEFREGLMHVVQRDIHRLGLSGPPVVSGNMRSRRRSHLQHPAVDGPARSGDVGRLGGGEEPDNRSNLPRAAKTAKQDIHARPGQGDCGGAADSGIRGSDDGASQLDRHDRQLPRSGRPMPRGPAGLLSSGPVRAGVGTLSKLRSAWPSASGRLDEVVDAQICIANAPPVRR